MGKKWKIIWLIEISNFSWWPNGNLDYSVNEKSRKTLKSSIEKHFWTGKNKITKRKVLRTVLAVSLFSPFSCDSIPCFDLCAAKDCELRRRRLWVHELAAHILWSGKMGMRGAIPGYAYRTFA